MFADLILAARGAEHDVTSRIVLEAALLGIGRPLLIPTENTSRPIIGGTVAIAWKATPQAARAVAAAMPFLRRVTEIVVTTVDEGDRERGEADRLIRYLSWHGLHATVDRLRSEDQDPADTLLAAVGRKADLLVMGGYGHSRVREWIFGGFTQRVLADAPLRRSRCSSPISRPRRHRLFLLT
jgi:nucleotide-binding universal stress UspA family protein